MTRPMRDNPKPWWLLLVVLLPLLLVNWIVAALLLAPEPRDPVSYTFFVTQAQKSNVADITSSGDTIEGEFRQPVSYTPPGGTGGVQVTRFTTERPTFADDNLFPLLQANGVHVNGTPPDAPGPLWQRLLLGLTPALLLTLLLGWMLHPWTTRRRTAPDGAARKGTAREGVAGERAAGGSVAGERAAGEGVAGEGVASEETVRRDGSAGREAPRKTFADVAGLGAAAEDEAAGIVDLLRDPGRYRKLGVRFPHTVLLSGPPGVGKTLLARAVAGEAEVPPGKVVELDDYDTEIDTEIDTEAVVVFVSTTRDDAPGRFDRRIALRPPDLDGRREILAVHTRDVPLAPDVDLRTLADETAGLVGADLRHLVNEAALRAARQRHDTVTMDDFTAALARVTPAV